MCSADLHRRELFLDVFGVCLPRALCSREAVSAAVGVWLLAFGCAQPHVELIIESGTLITSRPGGVVDVAVEAPLLTSLSLTRNVLRRSNPEWD